MYGSTNKITSSAMMLKNTQLMGLLVILFVLPYMYYLPVSISFPVFHPPQESGHRH